MGSRRDQLNAFYKCMKKINKTIPEQLEGFNLLLKRSMQPTSIDLKTKELIGVALACYARCEYCIAYHVHAAFKAGARPEEILDSAMTSVLFGGGPAISYVSTSVLECIEEFKNDFIEKGENE